MPSSPSTAALLPRLAQAIAARSGQTVKNRIRDLGKRIQRRVTTHPVDGIALLELCEGLTDAAELKIPGAT